MKRSEKQLSRNKKFSLFCNLVALILRYNCVKSFRVNKIVHEIKFEGVWGWVKSKKMYPETTTFGKSLISVFQEFFASINKTFNLAERRGTRLSSYEV